MEQRYRILAQKGVALIGLTSSHWGAGIAEVVDGRLRSVSGLPGDPEPSAINGNIASSLNGEARVLRPAVRKSWLENGPAVVLLKEVEIVS